MFDRIIDFLLQCIGVFQFWTVIDQWERGIVLRLGKFQRILGPGFHFLVPFLVDRVCTEDIYRRVAQLQPQSLTTADGKNVVLTAVITSKVRNVKKVVLEAGGHDESVVGIIPGVIGELVSGVSWSDLTTEEFRRTVLAASRAKASKWGVHVEDVQFADIIQARSYRFFQDQIHK